MNIDEILALERELTDEEFLFLEGETLKSVREFSKRIDELLPDIARKDPALADRLEVSSNTMLLAMESAAAIPERGKLDEAALRDMARAVRPSRRMRPRRR